MIDIFMGMLLTLSILARANKNKRQEKLTNIFRLASGRVTVLEIGKDGLAGRSS